MMKIIHCEDENGFLWATVAENEDACDMGILIGPPEGLPLEIHNALVKDGFYTAFDLMGKRRKLLDILGKLKVENKKAELRNIISIYQSAYWGE